MGASSLARMKGEQFLNFNQGIPPPNRCNPLNDLVQWLGYYPGASADPPGLEDGHFW